MQGRGVRAKLGEVAKRGADRARVHVQARDKLRGAAVTVTSGTRPKGRPYARITVTGGSSEMERRQVLAAATR
jgi:hypothetical protein